MSKRYQIEVLLRPAVEMYSGIVCLSLGALVMMSPSIIFTPKPVAMGCAYVLFGFAAYDFFHGFRVLEYRNQMKRTPDYSLSMGKLPTKRGRTFLGRGFRWSQLHTQRLVDTYDDRYASFVEVADNHDPLEGVRDVFSSIPVLRNLVAVNSSLNPLRAPQNTGGNPHIHGVGTQLRDVHIPTKSREGNMLVIGTTGCGKTRYSEVLISQDIHVGDVVVVVDPKGDAELLRRVVLEAIRSGRENEVSIFHLGHPDQSARYNGIGSFSRITEVATRITNQLPTEGNSAAFKEFSWRFVNVAARALNALGDRAVYREIQNAIDDIEPLMKRYFKHLFKREPDLDAKFKHHQASSAVKEEVPMRYSSRTLESYRYFQFYNENSHLFTDTVSGDLVSVYKYDKTYYDKLVSSLGPLLEKLTSGKTGELLSPDYLDVNDPREILDWREVINAKGIVYVGLDAMSDATVSAAVGQTMLADMTAVAGEIYKFHEGEKPRVQLHFDEVNELIGEEFVPMVNKCRGAGMIVTAYTQTIQDIEAKIGSAAKAEQILGNFNHLVMMRVKNKRTAEHLTDQLPMVTVKQVMAVSGAVDSDYTTGSMFTSRNEDRTSSREQTMLDPSIMTQLPNGQGFVWMEGGRLYKLVFPMPVVDSFETSMPTNAQELIAKMNAIEIREDWASSDNWWQEAWDGD